MTGLREHIRAEKERQAGKQIPTKMSRYKGRTAVWDSPKAEEPKMLSTRDCLSYFLKYICELQYLVFDNDSRQSKIEVLDILKKPKSVPGLLQLCHKFALDIPEDETLLDLTLAMILEYIGLVCGQPDAFEFLESQERDFNRWKQDILQNISRILEQTKTALRIIKRRGLNEDMIKRYE